MLTTTMMMTAEWTREPCWLCHYGLWLWYAACLWLRGVSNHTQNYGRRVRSARVRRKAVGILFDEFESLIPVSNVEVLFLIYYDASATAAKSLSSMLFCYKIFVSLDATPSEYSRICTHMNSDLENVISSCRTPCRKYLRTFWFSFFQRFTSYRVHTSQDLSCRHCMTLTTWHVTPWLAL